PRTRHSSALSARTRSLPSNMTCPSVILPPVGSSRTTDRAVIVLPEPDSPTRPTVSPARTARSTPSTARTTRWRPVICVCRPDICSSGAAPETGSFEEVVNDIPRYPGDVVVTEVVSQAGRPGDRADGEDGAATVVGEQCHVSPHEG